MENNIKNSDTYMKAIYTLLFCKSSGVDAYFNYNGTRVSSNDIDFNKVKKIEEIKNKENDIDLLNKEEIKIIFKEKQEEWDKLYNSSLWSSLMNGFRHEINEIFKRDKINEKAKIEYFISVGNKLIFEEYKEDFRKFVETNINSGKGIEIIKTSLYIMDILDRTRSVRKAKKALSELKVDLYHDAVCEIIFKYSKKGPEFYCAAVSHKISKMERKAITIKKIENKKLANNEKNIAKRKIIL